MALIGKMQFSKYHFNVGTQRELVPATFPLKWNQSVKSITRDWSHEAFRASSCRDLSQKFKPVWTCKTSCTNQTQVCETCGWQKWLVHTMGLVMCDLLRGHVTGTILVHIGSNLIADSWQSVISLGVKQMQTNVNGGVDEKGLSPNPSSLKCLP